MNRLPINTCILGAIAALSTHAAAQIHEGDVVLMTNTGVIETMAQIDGAFVPACVFAADLSNGSTTDPGFDSFNNAFGNSQNVFLDIMSHLREWDGAGFVSAAPTQIRITRGFDGPVFSPSEGAGPALGFAVAANSSGKWHRHYLFTLTADQPDGIYAVELRLRASGGSPANSEPFWFVFNKNISEGQFILAIGATLNTLSSCGASCLGDIADDFGLTADEGGGPDGQVDFGDFAALLGLIGPCPGGTVGCVGDIADDFGLTVDEGGGPDGQVDFGDFAALLGLIGPC